MISTTYPFRSSLIIRLANPTKEKELHRVIQRMQIDTVTPTVKPRSLNIDVGGRLSKQDAADLRSFRRLIRNCHISARGIWQTVCEYTLMAYSEVNTLKSKQPTTSKHASVLGVQMRTCT